MQKKYSELSVIVVYLDNVQQLIKSLTQFWIEVRKNKMILVANDCEALG